MQHKIRSIYKGDLGAIRYSEVRRTEVAFGTTNAVSLKYVLTGVENYVLDGQRHRIEPHELLFFSQGQPYLVYTERNNLNKGFCIDLDPAFIANAGLDVFGEESVLKISEEINALKIHQPQTDIKEQMVKILSTIGKDDDLQFEEALNELMQAYLSLEKEYRQKIDTLPAYHKHVKEEVFRKLLQAKSFIHDNKSKNLSLEEIARAAGLSKFYFQRLFRHFFGLSPSRYLESVRMQWALDLIRLDRYSFSEITFQLGYKDLAYFSRRFKQFYGCSPREMKIQENSKKVQVLVDGRD